MNLEKSMSERVSLEFPTPKLTGEISNTLTQREQEILDKVAHGNSNKDIADELYISRHTVKTHIYNIFRKIDVSSRIQAALWSVEQF